MLNVATDTITVVRDAGTFDADDYQFDSTRTLIHLLRRAIAHRQDVSISLGDADKLYVMPAFGTYFTRVRDMRAFCASPQQGYALQCLDASQVDEALKNQPGRNLNELMWIAGYYTSRGRLIDTCRRDDVVELKQWPNLTRLPAPPSAMATAALLTRHPTSITFAARLLHAPIDELFEFYTAAHCAGIATAVNRPPEIPKLEPHKNRTVLSQLIKRISGM